MKLILALTVALAGSTMALADDMSGSTPMGTMASTAPANTTALPAKTSMSPGRYSATVMPNFNNDMGKRLEKALAAVPGISKVKTMPSDGTIHFSVKRPVDVATIQKVVAQTDNDAAMSTPMLEHSLSTNPGL